MKERAEDRPVLFARDQKPESVEFGLNVLAFEAKNDDRQLRIVDLAQQFGETRIAARDKFGCRRRRRGNNDRVKLLAGHAKLAAVLINTRVGPRGHADRALRDLGGGSSGCARKYLPRIG